MFHLHIIFIFLKPQQVQWNECIKLLAEKAHTPLCGVSFFIIMLFFILFYL